MNKHRISAYHVSVTQATTALHPVFTSEHPTLKGLYNAARILHATTPNAFCTFEKLVGDTWTLDEPFFPTTPALGASVHLGQVPVGDYVFDAVYAYKVVTAELHDHFTFLPVGTTRNVLEVYRYVPHPAISKDYDPMVAGTRVDPGENTFIFAGGRDDADRVCGEALSRLRHARLDRHDSKVLRSAKALVADTIVSGLASHTYHNRPSVVLR